MGNYDPRKVGGIIGWAIFGLSAAFMALLIAYLVPGLVPSQARSTKL